MRRGGASGGKTATKKPLRFASRFRYNATFSTDQQQGFTMNPAAKAPDDSTYSGRFAARLRMLREKAGLSVEEAVQKIEANGYSLKLRTYYAWESGQNEPKLDAFPAISQALQLKRIRDLIPAG